MVWNESPNLESFSPTVNPAGQANVRQSPRVHGKHSTGSPSRGPPDSGCVMNPPVRQTNSIYPPPNERGNTNSRSQRRNRRRHRNVPLPIADMDPKGKHTQTDNRDRPAKRAKTGLLFLVHDSEQSVRDSEGAGPQRVMDVNLSASSTAGRTEGWNVATGMADTTRTGEGAGPYVNVEIRNVSGLPGGSVNVNGNGQPGTGPFYNFHRGEGGMDGNVKCGNVCGGTGGSAEAGGKGGPSTGPFLNFDRGSPTFHVNIQY
ncbi:hypothetical protein K438DRAFT_1812561 [Mycena galopus ATCC 62051]|nr:hypothetical protein K438DRAFT_1812561 [Mycena galopus ATCC 62051]